MRWINVVLALVFAPVGARAAESDVLTIGFGAAVSSLDPMFHTPTPQYTMAAGARAAP